MDIKDTIAKDEFNKRFNDCTTKEKKWVLEEMDNAGFNFYDDI